MGSQERIQHGAQQSGHARVHDDWPLRVGQVEVVDQQKLCYKVSHADHKSAQEAGHQSDGSHSTICSCKRKKNQDLSKKTEQQVSSTQSSVVRTEPTGSVDTLHTDFRSSMLKTTSVYMQRADEGGTIQHLTCWNFLPGGDESWLRLAEDRSHLRRPGVPGAAGQSAQQREAHPGGRVLFAEVDGDLAWAHLRQNTPMIMITH